MRKPFQNLKETFEKLYLTYSADYLFSDPLWFVHRYERPEDQEVVAFLASAFAYGGVPQIFQLLERLLAPLGTHPAEFIRSYEPDHHPDLFRGIYYRFHSRNDLKILIYLLSHVLRRDGSLAASFQRHFSLEDEDVGPALSRWTDEILQSELGFFFKSGRLPADSPVRFFFSSPEKGSSCKRLNLFLRWMVRGPDGLDLGLWNFIPPSKLVIPLDIHIYRIARKLRLTRRRSPNWRMAQEITRNLKNLDAADPIKYDFSLTRLGILKIGTSSLNIQ